MPKENTKIIIEIEVPSLEPHQYEDIDNKVKDGLEMVKNHLDTYQILSSNSSIIINR